jgi:hypothetical protein
MFNTPGVISYLSIHLGAISKVLEEGREGSQRGCTCSTSKGSILTMLAVLLRRGNQPRDRVDGCRERRKGWNLC